jgi:hypothetical protein
MTNNGMERSLSRRGLLRVAGAASGAAVAIGAAASFAGAAPAGSSSGSSGGALRHPGMLHTDADFVRIRAKLAAGAQPYQAGWNVLAANRFSSSTWKPRPLPVVYRGSGTPQNYGILYRDIAAAYQNALRWRITGDTAHGNTARDILNAWSATLTKVDGSSDRFLAAGIYGYEFANAAELMRGYPGFNLARFQHMMANVFAPVSESFLTDHNGTVVTHYWPNWDLSSIACVLATGILCDNPAQIHRAIDYFQHGAGNGSIHNAIPVVYPNGLAQWMEAGRDQGHAMFGVGLMGTICEMAWNQGIDLYGYDDNLFLKGAEYVAKWNLGESVPYTPWVWRKGPSERIPLPVVSPGGRGGSRPIWAGIANHYIQRRGLQAPYVSRIAAKVAPEGGGGNYGPNSGGFDHLGFGTLMFTRDRSITTASAAHRSAAASAAAPAVTHGKTPAAPHASGSALGSDPGNDPGHASGHASGQIPGNDRHPATASPSGAVTPTGGHLASTGAGNLPLYAGGAGLAAVAGGLLLRLRRHIS